MASLIPKRAAERSRACAIMPIKRLEQKTMKTIILVVVGLITLKLEVLPRSNEDKTWKQPLIHFRSSDPGSWLPWVNRIDDTLKEYRSGSTEHRVACSYHSSPLGERQVCDVPVDDFHPCTSGNQYNYAEAGPCVFLKLNKIFDWKPEPYNLTKDLPEDMPEYLKQHIGILSGKPEANTVWVSCGGENPADVENVGPIQYIPRRGFPAYYYPFSNKEGYLSPLVAVLFEKPMTGVVIHIECKAWAKNYDRYERRGSVHFELMVDRG